MHLERFLSECRECHIEIDETLLLLNEHKKYFLYRGNTIELPFAEFDFHRFDLFFVEFIFRNGFSGNADFFIKMIGIAKDIALTYEECSEEYRRRCRIENAKRHALGEREFTLAEKQTLADDTLYEFLATRWAVAQCTIDEVVEMRRMLRSKLTYYDNYWKCADLLERLSPDDLFTLRNSSIGETRFAHVLYTIDTCLARYLSFITGHPTPAALSDENVDEQLPHSRCKFCGDVMADWGKKPRAHCGKPACKRIFERDRKSNSRRRQKEKEQAAKGVSLASARRKGFRGFPYDGMDSNG